MSEQSFNRDSEAENRRNENKEINVTRKEFRELQERMETIDRALAEEIIERTALLKEISEQMQQMISDGKDNSDFLIKLKDGFNLLNRMTQVTLGSVGAYVVMRILSLVFGSSD
jgi:predicted transcriptional regulator